MHIKNAFPCTEFEEKIHSHLPQCSEDTTGISVTAAGGVTLDKATSLTLCYRKLHFFFHPRYFMSLLLSLNYKDYIETHYGSVYT